MFVLRYATLEEGFGFCLVKGEALLSEAFAADSAMGMFEIDTITGEPYRRRGYAAIDKDVEGLKRHYGWPQERMVEQSAQLTFLLLARADELRALLDT